MFCNIEKDGADYCSGDTESIQVLTFLTPSTKSRSTNRVENEGIFIDKLVNWISRLENANAYDSKKVLEIELVRFCSDLRRVYCCSSFVSNKRYYFINLRISSY
jgi:hypothetical protein